MDKVRYTSLKFKVWEDKFIKIERQMQQLHLEDIKMVDTQEADIKGGRYKPD